MINNIDISNVTIAILIAGYNKEVINKYERNITEKQNFIEHSQNIESEVNYQASNIMNLILGDLDVYGYSYNAKYSKMQLLIVLICIGIMQMVFLHLGKNISLQN